MTAASSRPPRVTVINAVFNGAETLPRFLDSVATQTYADVELIVIDGGSTDGTVDLLRAHDTGIAYWESQADRGIYHAWNKALAHVSGDWICFLGADDYFWSRDVLERMAPHLAAAAPKTRLVYGRVAIVSAAGEVLRYEGRPWEQAGQDFSRIMSIPHPGLLHHKSLFDAHGAFDERFRIAADYDWLLRELPACPALFVPDIVTVGVQRGGVSYSSKTMPLMLEELARVRHKHDLREPNWLQMSSIERNMRTAALLGRMFGERGYRRIVNTIRRMAGRQMG